MNIKPACGLQDSEVRLMVRAGVGPVSPPSFKAADVEMCRWAVGEIKTLREAVHRHQVPVAVEWGLPAEAKLGAIQAANVLHDAQLADAKSRLAHTQAGLTIWMERSKANARELDEAYDAMCEMAKTLDCAEDWPAIKTKLAERDALLAKLRGELA